MEAGPLHVVHAGSHALQMPLLFAYFRSGVQDATHDEGNSRNGKAAAQVAQSPAVGPVQVAQLS